MYLFIFCHIEDSLNNDLFLRIAHVSRRDLLFWYDEFVTSGVFEFCSFQFETETEGGKLRQDVLAAGSVGSGPLPSGIISLLSGQEEMFAFRRAVSTRTLVGFMVFF